MTYITASIGPITSAARLARKCRESGIEAGLMQTPAQINKGGCAYSVRFPPEALEAVKSISERYNIQLKKLFKEEKIGEEKVYHDIS